MVSWEWSGLLGDWADLLPRSYLCLIQGPHLNIGGNVPAARFETFEDSLKIYHDHIRICYYKGVELTMKR